MNVKGESGKIRGSGKLDYSDISIPITISGNAKSIEDKVSNSNHLNITFHLSRDFSIINVVSLNGSTLNNSEGEYSGKSNTCRGTDWIKYNGELLKNEGVRVDLTLKKVEKPKLENWKKRMMNTLLEYGILEE